MSKASIIAAAALATVVAASPALAVPVYTNTFDSPAVSGISYGPNGDSSSVTFNTGAGLDQSGGPFGYVTPDGGQTAHLQSGGLISIDLTSFLTAGSDYALSFASAARPGYDNLPVTVSFNGTVLSSFTPTSTAFTMAGPLLFTAATTGRDLLTFSGAITGSDSNAAIDTISVSAAPEASTWMMMILGFGLVGGVMRSAYRRSEESFTRKVRSIAAA